MSLLKPTHGEITDRLSILYRRMVERKILEQDNSAARDEAAELCGYLWANENPEGYEKLMHTGLLVSVNAALWERENLIRRVGISDTELAAITKETSMLNDWRARLIASIDGLPSSPKIHRS